MCIRDRLQRRSQSQLLHRFVSANHSRQDVYKRQVSEEDDGWAIRRAGGILVEKHGLKLAAVKIVSFFRRDWIENHRNHAGYAVRFDDKVWPCLLYTSRCV